MSQIYECRNMGCQCQKCHMLFKLHGYIFYSILDFCLFKIDTVLSDRRYLGKHSQRLEQKVQVSYFRSRWLIFVKFMPWWWCWMDILPSTSCFCCFALCGKSWAKIRFYLGSRKRVRSTEGHYKKTAWITKSSNF